ncbi:MAG TPA: YadA C-terminal domain-containing protein, partial [Acinetobacter sp.]|nr:YadA C-terminal domain-containing protein [Acinetobacter sp.]
GLTNVNNRLDDVQRTAYRGTAIALAAQQQVPNIKPGQFAVFGGVGHYESESAGALGVVGALNDRTSFSAALGFAGGSEVGGRIGVAYVFGGN